MQCPSIAGRHSVWVRFESLKLFFGHFFGFCAKTWRILEPICVAEPCLAHAPFLTSTCLIPLKHAAKSYVLPAVDEFSTVTRGFRNEGSMYANPTREGWLVDHWWLMKPKEHKSHDMPWCFFDHVSRLPMSPHQEPFSCTIERFFIMLTVSPWLIICWSPQLECHWKNLRRLGYSGLLRLALAFRGLAKGFWHLHGTSETSWSWQGGCGDPEGEWKIHENPRNEWTFL